MKNTILSILYLVFSFLPFASLRAEGNELEVTAQHLLSNQNEKGVFIGSLDGELMFAIRELTSADDSIGYARNLYKLQQNGDNYEKVIVRNLANPINDCGFVKYKDGLVLVGGNTPNGLSSDVRILKGDGDVVLASLPEAITQPAVGVINDWLIVTAGKTANGLNNRAWKLNLKHENTAWEALAPIPSVSDEMLSAVQNSGDEDIFYLFGDKVQSYSLKSNTWKDLTDRSSSFIDARGQLPIPMGTHHILFLDPQGRYCTYHTVTGQWDNKGFVGDRGENTLISKWGDDYVVLSYGDLSKVSFINHVSFGFLNYAVLIVYLIAMLGVGFYFSFKGKTATTDDFFKGGGQIPWWAAGISIFATTLSAITFMAIPAKAYVTNWLYFPMSFSILLIVPIVIHWYVPFFRNLNLTSAYEYLELRFNLTVRLLSSLLFIIFMVTRIGIVLYLPSVALSTVTGIDLLTCILMMSLVTIIYSTVGGVEAVVWGDVIQGFILVGGALLAAIYLVVGSGGFGETISIAMDAHKFKMLDFSFDFTQPTFWVIFFGAGIANSLITYTSDQTVVQRYLTTSDMAKTKSSIWLNGLISLPVLVVFYFIGTALYSFFTLHPDLLPTTMTNSEGIFPYFIMNELPAGVAGLLIAAIFAATMSTLSSNINSASTAITIDFAKRLFPHTSDRKQVRIAQISGVIVGVLGTYLAIVLSQMEVKSFFDEFNTFIGLLTSGLGGLFAISIFMPRVRGYAALASLLASVAFLLWLQSNSPVNFMMYGLIGIVSSMALAYVFSFIFPEKAKNLAGLTWSQRNKTAVKN